MFKDKPVVLHKTTTITQSSWKAAEAFLYALKNIQLVDLIEKRTEIKVLSEYRLAVQYIKIAASDKEKGGNPNHPPCDTKMVKITASVRDSLGSFIDATGWITLIFFRENSMEWMVTDFENAIEVNGDRYFVDFRWNKRLPTANPIQAEIECTLEKSKHLEEVDFSPLR